MKEEKYNEVKEYIKNKEYIKPSILMEEFSMGYTRGRNIIDLLEKEKLISPTEETGKWKIIN